MPAKRSLQHSCRGQASTLVLNILSRMGIPASLPVNPCLKFLGKRPNLERVPFWFDLGKRINIDYRPCNTRLAVNSLPVQSDPLRITPYTSISYVDLVQDAIMVFQTCVCAYVAPGLQSWDLTFTKISGIKSSSNSGSIDWWYQRGD